MNTKYLPSFVNDVSKGEILSQVFRRDLKPRHGLQPLYIDENQKTISTVCQHFTTA